MSWFILQGDARHIPLKDESVQCVVTSPPYWGLRDYGIPPSVWGGDLVCIHEWSNHERQGYHAGQGFENLQQWNGQERAPKEIPHTTKVLSAFCSLCSAWFGVLGLEPTPELYIEHMVEIFQEVKRVLRKDATVWLNLGDSYAGSWGNYHPTGKGGQRPKATERFQREAWGDKSFKPPMADAPGFKPKDLCGIPWRVAFALQQPYHTGPIREERDRAWLAALIDGEGTIGIKRDKGRSNGGTGDCQPGFSVFVSIGNQDRELLDRCVAITGYGTVGLKDRPFIDGRGIRSRRDYFGWWISSNQAVNVIRDIYPFLVAKRRQAIIAYSLDVSNKGGRSLRGNKPLPLDEQEWRGRLHELCKAANQREAFEMPGRLIEPPPMFEPGFYLRSDIIWAKPNPMPESVTDRPTRAHEYIFLLTKNARYFFDQQAVREPHSNPEFINKEKYWTLGEHNKFSSKEGNRSVEFGTKWSPKERAYNPLGRNLRSVWTMATQPFPDAHFATFPEELAVRCIKAGTSEKGCCAKCGAPWVRVTKRIVHPPTDRINNNQFKHDAMTTHGEGASTLRCVVERRQKKPNGWQDGPTGHDQVPAGNYGGKWRDEDPQASGLRLAQNRGKVRDNGGDHDNPFLASRTVGWKRSCKCRVTDRRPCVVFDPFSGAGTTPLVADKLGRIGIGLDLKGDYCRMAYKRIHSDAPLLNWVDSITAVTGEPIFP